MSAGTPVRVTIEGTLERGVTKHRDRFTHSSGTWLLLRDADDVVVEDMAPARLWQYGDVIVNTVHGWTLTRGPVTWRISIGPDDRRDSWTDADVDEALETEPYDAQLKVLRYQAGDH